MFWLEKKEEKCWFLYFFYYYWLIMYIECVDWLINEMGVVLVLIFEYVEVK